VGKTSVAAATALKTALAGHKCLVLTIDPATRLRTALEMDLGGTEQKVPLHDAEENGELWAAIVNIRASLDRAVLREAKPEEAQSILEHPLYQVLITSLAGMQELIAIERIHQAVAEGYHSIFIDTAPSRHALEFLDKPEFFAHLVSFPIVKLVGRTYQWWLRSRLARLSRMTFELYTRVEEILGATLVHQVLDFFSIFRKIAEGYADRAEQTLSMLRDPHTTSFTIVTTPFKARRDAEYFLTELRKRKFSVSAMVVNRIWPRFPATVPPDSHPMLQELLTWYGNVSGAHHRIWNDVSRQFSSQIPKLIPLTELPRDVDGVSALYELVRVMETWHTQGANSSKFSR